MAQATGSRWSGSGRLRLGGAPDQRVRGQRVNVPRKGKANPQRSPRAVGRPRAMPGTASGAAGMGRAIAPRKQRSIRCAATVTRVEGTTRKPPGCGAGHRAGSKTHGTCRSTPSGPGRSSDGPAVARLSTSPTCTGLWSRWFSLIASLTGRAPLNRSSPCPILWVPGLSSLAGVGPRVVRGRSRRACHAVPGRWSS